MYNQILQGIKSKHGLVSDNDVKNCLQSMQPQVKSLRQAFRTFPVRFDYTNYKIQQAYMFAYLSALY